MNRKSSQWVKLVNDTHLRPAFGTLGADQLTSSKITAYIAQRRKQGVANATINRELSLLLRAFTLAANC